MLGDAQMLVGVLDRGWGLLLGRKLVRGGNLMGRWTIVWLS